MRQDFVTKLELQLREAAAREAGGRSLTGELRAGLRAAPRRLAPAVAVLALVVVAVVVAIGALRNGDTTPAQPGPQLIARTPLVSEGATIASGFGAVWVADSQGGQLLRLDPRTRAVEARIPLGGGAVVSTGAGAVWALGFSDLLKIDPDRNRVVARIPVRGAVRGFRAGDVLPVAGAVWLVGGDQVARVDLRRNAIGRPITTSAGGFHTLNAGTDGRSIYVMRADGALLGFDGGTGERRSSAHAAVTGPIAAVTAGSVIVARETGVTALDPRSGGARWSRDLGAQRLNGAVLAGRTLWLQATDRTGHRDRLWRIDAQSGQVIGSLTLPAFGVSGMAAVGDRAWIITLGGELLIAG